jgi:hypothetical protein
VLSTWLGARRELIIHCALLSKPVKSQILLLEYLIKAVPESLHAKSSSGHTPLALAFSLRRFASARALIAAGADQTVRDHTGKNILHILLCGIHSSAKNDEDGLQEMLGLIDPRLVASLLTERSQDGPGSSSPLSLWLHTGNGYHYHYGNRANEDLNYETKSRIASLRILLEFSSKSGNEDLDLLDGAGSY